MCLPSSIIRVVTAWLSWLIPWRFSADTLNLYRVPAKITYFQYWEYGQKLHLLVNCDVKHRIFIFSLPGLRFCTTKLIASPDAVILRLCFSPWSLWSENKRIDALHNSGRIKYIKFIYIWISRKIFAKMYLEGYYILWHSLILVSFRCVVQPN